MPRASLYCHTACLSDERWTQGVECDLENLECDTIIPPVASKDEPPGLWVQSSRENVIFTLSRCFSRSRTTIQTFMLRIPPTNIPPGEKKKEKKEKVSIGSSTPKKKIQRSREQLSSSSAVFYSALREAFFPLK